MRRVKISNVEWSHNLLRVFAYDSQAPDCCWTFFVDRSIELLWILETFGAGRHRGALDLDEGRHVLRDVCFAPQGYLCGTA